MLALHFVNLFFTGILACIEVPRHYGLRVPVEVLSEDFQRPMLAWDVDAPPKNWKAVDQRRSVLSRASMPGRADSYFPGAPSCRRKLL